MCVLPYSAVLGKRALRQTGNYEALRYIRTYKIRSLVEVA